ncbi:MAG: squalene--hopene cyclase [Phycisphaerales bacterium]
MPSVLEPAESARHFSASTEPLSLASRALDAGIEALFRKQRAERADSSRDWAPMPGRHWCAELEGDSILSSEYLLMKVILSQESDPADSPKLKRIANHLRLTQRKPGVALPHEGLGGWGQYPGSPPDVSATVKAYFALKLFGDHPDTPHMKAARELILALGGAEKCNTFSTFYLACLGQVTWDACPAIPPEVVLLPRWFPFHMDKVAAWTRTMILPLALCSALRPVRHLPAELGIDELFINKTYKHTLAKDWNRGNPVCWQNFFLACDRFLKFAQRHHLSPLRQRSIREAEQWILSRMTPETTEGLGAIFPPMVYVQIALRALGYTRTEPVIRQAEKDLDAFMIDEPSADPTLDHIRLQPCFSPVWDTGIALYALTEAGLSAAGDERIAQTCDWLLDRRVKMTGDWVRNLRPADQGIRLSPGTATEAAAWAFEYRNDWYPDVDDTAMVAKALWRAGDRPGQTRNRDAARAATRWILAMQNDDGGWAAFDRTRDRPWMEAIPFADHNAMQDPSCADITGRTVESLITCGVPATHPAIARAIKYILSHQQPEGCWWGRWGVNYIYGTWQALGGLAAAGVISPPGSPSPAHPAHPAAAKALAWLRSVQNPDGGFGESANSYLDRSLMGRGPSTASQTAWGLTCLLYLVHPADDAATRAATWLARNQAAQDKPPFTPARNADPDAFNFDWERLAATDFSPELAGGWHEHHFTGTGFPRVFYLRYNLYRHYFPVMALARYVRLLRQTSPPT